MSHSLDLWVKKLFLSSYRKKMHFHQAFNNTLLFPSIQTFHLTVVMGRFGILSAYFALYSLQEINQV